MGETITHTQRFLKATCLVDLGFRDYLAARCLLNNRLIIPGLTLASTAIEKYLKALLVLKLDEEENYYYHFDRFDKLNDILERNNIDVTKNFDPVFLNILEKAFKIRYYDRLKQPVTIGLYLNQFIGELDHTIHNLEKLADLSLTYRRAIEHKDPHLYENNFILKNQDKREFMESPDTAFSVRIYVSSCVQKEDTVVGRDIINKYEGRMAIFENPFDAFRVPGIV